MDKQSPAYQIVQKKMLQQDAFSQWLGIQLLELHSGYVCLQMTVRPEMTNGFGIAHGGITYALADSALAFAANSHGRHSLSVDTSIAHLKSVQAGDRLEAKVQEESLSHKVGVYTVSIWNQDGDKVAFFKGVVYRSSKQWLESAKSE